MNVKFFFQILAAMAGSISILIFDQSSNAQTIILISSSYYNYSKWDRYAEQGKTEIALEYCDRAIEANPNLANAYVVRGIFYARQNRIEIALSDYNRAIELDPNLAEAYSQSRYCI